MHRGVRTFTSSRFPPLSHNEPTRLYRIKGGNGQPGIGTHDAPNGVAGDGALSVGEPRRLAPRRLPERAHPDRAAGQAADLPGGLPDRRAEMIGVEGAVAW